LRPPDLFELAKRSLVEFGIAVERASRRTAGGG